MNVQWQPKYFGPVVEGWKQGSSTSGRDPRGVDLAIIPLFKRLSARDLCNAAMTCKAWLSFAFDKSVYGKAIGINSNGRLPLLESISILVNSKLLEQLGTSGERLMAHNPQTEWAKAVIAKTSAITLEDGDSVACRVVYQDHNLGSGKQSVVGPFPLSLELSQTLCNSPPIDLEAVVEQVAHEVSTWLIRPRTDILDVSDEEGITEKILADLLLNFTFRGHSLVFLGGAKGDVLLRANAALAIVEGSMDFDGTFLEALIRRSQVIGLPMFVHLIRILAKAPKVILMLSGYIESEMGAFKNLGDIQPFRNWLKECKKNYDILLSFIYSIRIEGNEILDGISPGTDQITWADQQLERHKGKPGVYSPTSMEVIHNRLEENQENRMELYLKLIKRRAPHLWKLLSDISATIASID